MLFIQSLNPWLHFQRELSGYSQYAYFRRADGARFVVVDVFDPWVEFGQLDNEIRPKFVTELKDNFYDAVLIAVGHHEFMELGADFIRQLCKANSVIYDLKSILPKEYSDIRL